MGFYETPHRDWEARISDAMTRGTFTAEDRKDAQYWNACLVGEYHGVPTFVDLAFPGKHRLLYALGYVFTAAVMDNNVKLARRCYERVYGRLPRASDAFSWRNPTGVSHASA